MKKFSHSVVSELISGNRRKMMAHGALVTLGIVVMGIMFFMLSHSALTLDYEAPGQVIEEHLAEEESFVPLQEGEENGAYIEHEDADEAAMEADAVDADSDDNAHDNDDCDDESVARGSDDAHIGYDSHEGSDDENYVLSDAYDGLSDDARLEAQLLLLFDTWNLFNYVTEVTITDGNNVVMGDDDWFDYGDDYTFRIRFDNILIQGLALDYHTDGMLHYRLPNELKVSDTKLGIEIIDSNNVVIGWYNSYTDGRIEVWFLNHPSVHPALQFFYLSIEATFLMDEPGEMEFGVDYDKEFNYIKLPEAGLEVDKNASVYNTETETLEHEIKITARNFDIRNIRLHDKMLFNILTSSDGRPIQDPLVHNVNHYDPYNIFKDFEVQFGEDGNLITLTSEDDGIIWEGQDGDKHYHIEWRFDDAGESYYLFFDFGEDNILDKDDYIILKYTLYFESILDYFAEESLIQRLMNSLLFENIATAFGVQADSDDRELVPVKDNTETPLTREIVEKSGNKSGNKISWAGKIGDKESPIPLNGMHIIDRLGPGQTFLRDSLRVFISNNFTSLHRELTDVELNECLKLPVPDDTSFTFRFEVPEGAFLGFDEIYYIELFYDTEVEEGVYSFENELAVLVRDLESSVEEIIVETGIEKSSVMTSDEIIYTITLTVDKGNEGAWIALLDEAWVWVDNAGLNIIETPTGNRVIVNPENLEVKILNGTTDEDTLLNSLMNQTGTPTLRGLEWYNWPFEDEKVIVISYTMPLNRLAPAPNSEIEIGDMLRSGSNISNQVRLEVDRAFIMSARTHDCWPIQKRAEPNLDDHTGRVFDYTVDVNFRAKALNNSNIYNLFSADENDYAIFFDQFDEELEYVPGSLYVVVIDDRDDSDDKWGDRWYFGPFIADGIGFIELVEYDKVTSTIQAQLKDMPLLEWDSDLKASSPIDPNPSQDSLTWVSDQTRFVVHYQLRIKEEFLGSNKDMPDLKNTATIRTNNTNRIYGDFDSSASVEFDDRVLSKTMIHDGTNVVEFLITINELGKKIVPEGIADDWFTAVDELGEDSDLAYFVDSVVFFTKEWNDLEGKWGDTWIEVDPDAADPTGKLWSVNLRNERCLEFTLPDETPIQIRYRSLVTVPLGEEAKISNAVTVFGYSITYSDSFEVLDRDAYGERERQRITLLKRDFIEHTPLEGAEFDLYLAIQTTNEPYAGHNAVARPDKPPVHFGAGEPGGQDGMTFYFVQNGTTLTNGEFYFDYWLYPSQKYVYLLIEKTPPPGYLLPEDRESCETLFVIHATTQDEQDALETRLGREVNFDISDYIYITNKSSIRLPDTGGLGVPLLYLGAIMLFLATAGIVTRARRRANTR